MANLYGQVQYVFMNSKLRPNTKKFRFVVIGSIRKKLRHVLVV